jgi:RNA polymerase sigma-70 factor (ECF subfamily)
VVRQEKRNLSVHPGLLAVSGGDEQAGSEAALLRAAQAGDEAALDRLLALHERGLLTLCRGILGHAEDAEDAVQETFFRALRALPRFQFGQATFRTWLFRIALNLCLDWKRRRRSIEVWDEEQPCLKTRDASPETVALRRLQVIEALSVLPPQRREGWSATEIGVAMGWNVKRVYNELYHARTALAEWHARGAEEGADG